MNTPAWLPSFCAFVVATICAGATGDPPISFAEAIGTNFPRWDTNHDGILSPTEIDAAVMNPDNRGSAAAALAALKRAERDPRAKLPALTLRYLQECAATPRSPDHPDFPRMFAQGGERLAAVTSRELFVGPPRTETIRQGKLGNCFSLAPLGAMAHRDPSEIEAMILSEGDGRCRVKFGKTSVVVGLPTDAEIALTSSNQDSGLWVNTYEKALGKALNDARPEVERVRLPIDALARGGSAGKMLSYLTGHDIVRIGFSFAKDQPAIDVGSSPQAVELRRQLTSAAGEHRLMTCGTTTVGVPGLTPNHAYAVLDYDQKTDEVVLWNPHGDDFTPKGKAGATHGYPKKSGVFRMPLTDWIVHFTGMAYEVRAK